MAESGGDHLAHRRERADRPAHVLPGPD